MASKTTSTSQHILKEVGGAENVTSLTHCATRLRFQLADQDKVDVAALESDPAVLGVVKQGTTGLQVVMGGGVAEYYGDITKEPGMGDSDEKAASSKKEYGGVRSRYSFIDYAFEFLSDTFRPILWALLGASLIITLLVLADTFGLQDFRAPMDEQPPTYVFMHAMWRSVFYFLPIMVGATAARKLGANEWVGAAIPAALLTPEFLALGEPGDVVQVFGLPMVINSYAGQVFPPLIAAIGLFWVEKGLKKIIPSSVQMVFVPFFSLLIMIPATAFFLGPFGIFIGEGISSFLDAVNNFSPFILAIIIPLLYPFLVPLGLHWPLNAIMIQNIATLGYDFIQGPMGAWNFACFGVVTGVMIVSLREGNKSMRQVSLGGMMAGLLGGISEPSLYGVLLRFRKSYARLLPGCFLGGVVMGIFNIKAYAFVFTSLLTIPAMDPWWGYTIGIAVAFFTSMFLVIFFDYRTKDEKAEALAKIAAEREAANEAEEERIDAASLDAAVIGGAAAAGGTATATAVKPALMAGAITELGAPLEGRVMPLAEVPDAAFASGALGNGVGIEPIGDTVVAPADGLILTVQKTGHAVGLRLDSGVELLIHIGVDTVQMNGEGFEVLVERRQQVTAGTPLIRFDTAKIAEAGFSAVTPVLVVNTKKFASVEGHPAEHVNLGDNIITIKANDE
ncbi:PTS transporter subunit EIIC [Corynebacterium testudinoris]|uniref:PTS system mannose-specific EIIBCA component n=1 Tax=Corynebacterium testudinoris TaxID=136857 RepID=A0A0G3H5L0_9CORY|nr:glucose PTS transporter subunit IIA [Corynebacterium testudinoris]AKK08644.1 PTS system mannose-specific EIIBCA component [Corynebacterium testudinoris]MBX8996573.1 PTS transporter subunit EIIC [Corynebacterium testudinoris]